jgi:hypothetical protein
MVVGMVVGMEVAAMAAVAIGAAAGGFLGLPAAEPCLAALLIAGGGIHTPARESGFAIDDAGI